MIVVIAMFVFVAALILGMYWLLVVRPEGQRQAAMVKRLKGNARQRSIRRELFKRADAMGVWSDASKAGRVNALVRPLHQMLEQSGLEMNVAGLLVLMLFSALIAFSVVLVLVHWFLVALAACVAAAWLPVLHVSRKRKKRINKFEEQFPEAIDLIARALRAGHAFPAGLSMVAEEMAAPIGPEFQVLYDHQNFGMPLPEAMRAFAQRVPLLDAKFFVTAVLTQREAGGNLAEVLDNLASVIRDRFKVKRQVRVISAHGRITGWVLVGLPPSLATMLTLIAPKHMGELFFTSLGHWMLAGAVALQVIGSLIIRKLVQIEY